MSTTETRRHLVVSPARNEEKFIERTILSMVNQTVKPAAWIIVDDGSTDGTAEIVARYSEQFPWIKLLRREDRGYYSYGTGIVNAFNEGLRLVDKDSFDYITKMDCDLEFESDYFERLFLEFEKDKSLGIAGGQLYVFENGEWKEERFARYFVYGPSKIYREIVFDQIGGLLPYPGWDTMDALRAWSYGWSTRVLPNCRVHHLRKTATNVNKHLDYGKTHYILGGSLLFLLVRCLYKLSERPIFIGSLETFWGYLWYAFVKKPERWPDPKDRDRFRRFQIERLKHFQR